MVGDPDPVGDVGEGVDLGEGRGERLLGQHERVGGVDDLAHQTDVGVGGRGHHDQVRGRLGQQGLGQGPEDRERGGVDDRVHPGHDGHVGALGQHRQVGLRDRPEPDHEHASHAGHSHRRTRRR